MEGSLWTLFFRPMTMLIVGGDLRVEEAVLLCNPRIFSMAL